MVGTDLSIAMFATAIEERPLSPARHYLPLPLTPPRGLAQRQGARQRALDGGRVPRRAAAAALRRAQSERRELREGAAAGTRAATVSRGGPLRPSGAVPLGVPTDRPLSAAADGGAPS